MLDVDIKKLALADVVDAAWSEGQNIDLSGVGYGQIHWDNETDIVTHPFNYYKFLAGFTRITGARRIIEIGTHWGGSVRAMASGLTSPEDSIVVTFDISSIGAEQLRDHPVIRAHTIDALSPESIDICLKEFSEPDVDLVFIDIHRARDSVHEFWPTFLSFCIYNTIFSPTFVILDDIMLNDEMRRFWKICQTRYRQDAIDCTTVVPEIDGKKGFGLVRVVDS